MGTNIAIEFRAVYADLLAAVALNTRWPRAGASPGEPDEWFSGDASGLLAGELVARLAAGRRDYRCVLLGMVTHPGFRVDEQYRRTAGMVDERDRTLRPDAPVGPKAAAYFLHNGPPANHHGSTVPQLGSGTGDVGNVAQAELMIGDLVAEIGSVAFAAARAPYAALLEQFYPNEGFA